MKTTKILLSGIVAFLSVSIPVLAQEKNLVVNGSFENMSDNVRAPGAILWVDGVSSSNNTTVDVYSTEACGKDYDVPTNYMGTQSSKTGNNYAGFIAYYPDEVGIFKTKPGYQKYSEYTQLSFSEPLVAGKAYTISYNVALAEKSAYAVSGLGVYFSSAKVDVKKNSFLRVTPHIIWTEVQASTEWTTLTSTYVAVGGEQYVTIGCFDKYMEARKVIPANTNNSRKAYYFLDDVGVSPNPIIDKENISGILAGSCYALSHLNFETDKAVILADSYTELNSLAQFLKTYPYIAVYIDGHTDKTGSDEHNEKLSEARAAAVREYLVKSGIKANRLKAKGYGENHPVDTDNENSLVNRRVEITICDNGKN